MREGSAEHRPLGLLHDNPEQNSHQKLKHIYVTLLCVCICI